MRNTNSDPYSRRGRNAAFTLTTWLEFENEVEPTSELQQDIEVEEDFL